jgi:hypothetical protein
VETVTNPKTPINLEIVKAEVADSIEQIVEQRKYVILQPENNEDTG